MADLRDKRAKEIQVAIGEVLMQHWDPIGVANIPEARGEYDSYVGPVYRILASSRSKDELIDYLSHVETKLMGLQPPPRERFRVVLGKLLALDVRL